MSEPGPRTETAADGTAPLDPAEILTVQRLAAPTSRAPDFHGENRALVELIRAMAEAPGSVLHRLSELIVELCRAGSAGVSILETDEADAAIFRWHAAAGAWAPHVGATFPRDTSSCGVVIDCNTSLIFENPAARFSSIGLFEPACAEVLITPFSIDGVPVGTVWAVAHDPDRKFDAEDERLLSSLASAAAIVRKTTAALADLNATIEAKVEERTRERDRAWKNSRDLQAVVDADGVFRAANEAWTTILGWRPDEVVGRDHLNFVSPDDHPSTKDALAMTAGEELPFYESRYLHKDGGYRWISWVAAPEEGLVYASGRHVTVEKEAAAKLEATQEQLRQSQKMEAVGQLTGGIAHDFNNLLTGITGSLDLVRRRLAANRTDGIDRFMDAASTSAQRAAALTHRLLAFARRQSLDTKSEDVNALVSGLDDMLRRTLGEDVNLKIVLNPELWPALTDANQLENALLNLVINARDAMPKGGLLTVETVNTSLDARYAMVNDDVEAGDYVVISVSDTGSGMPPGVIAKAFDPFFTTKPLGQGTGLGLSMIYGFAKQSGGHVRIYSEVGHGTTVKLFLRRANTAETVVVPLPEFVTPLGLGEMVLVVEDDATVRLLITEVLEELGYRYLEAPDARTAIPLLESGQAIDLLVTDVGLPNMNGRQLAEIARQHRPNLKILFVTGYAENAAVRGGFLAPGMEMMTKPFALDALAAKIRELIER